MSTYQQVIVGGLLLVCAFIFGKYINRQPFSESKNDAGSSYQHSRILQIDSTNGPLGEPTNSHVESDARKQPATQSDSAAKSLRERILANRNRNALVPTPNDPSEGRDSNMEMSGLADRAVRKPVQIVRPDFSHLPLPDQNADVSQKFESTPLSNANQQATSGPVLIGPSNPSSGMPDAGASVKNLIVNSSQDASVERSSERDRSKRERMLQTQTSTGQQTLRGQLVHVSDRTTALTLDTNKFVNHRTGEGDTLRSISEKYYGKPNYYLDIYLANRDVLENLAEVPVGIELRIPVYDN
jgi:nucleoid-associated protein YgaU